MCNSVHDNMHLVYIRLIAGVAVCQLHSHLEGDDITKHNTTSSALSNPTHKIACTCIIDKLTNNFNNTVLRTSSTNIILC